MTLLAALSFGLWAILNTPTPTVVATPVPVVVPDDPFRLLALCESGGNPTAVSANGLYRGLYQFEQATFNGSVTRAGFPQWAGRLASDAPVTVQDAAARQLQSERGFSPWPACSRRLGLGGVA